ncbi:MAG: Selenide, water dikinase SelD [Acidimicrobiales bacterium]|nr:Selenide, water dikinase SelD [Acidimicrobiales bacterium]
MTDLRAPADVDRTDLDGMRLTEWTSCGGCAAKWGASLLSSLVSDFPASSDPALLVGLAPFDDAAVYRISDDLAMVSTTDFFPPLVDHPSDFGAIAAANACSDVFAMGGRVTIAVNIAAFPEHFPRAAIVAIFDAAAAVVAEAGGSVAGGHTIRNPEPIFGLAVQGLVHPDRIFRKEGALVGDVLMISKPLGTAIALAGGSPADKQEAIAGMRRLNRSASEVLQAHLGAVHAVTDVTGYGLFGHAWDMAERADAVFAFDDAALPLYSGVADALLRGVRTGGDPRNREHVEQHVLIRSGLGHDRVAIGYDPQTSGGLLAAVHPSIAGDLAAAGFTAIGSVVAGPPAIVLQ